MLVIISVMVLIAGVSLYEYFSARNWQQVTSSERNELVFEHRNREYGAYQIRKGYDVRLMLILGVMIFGIGSAYGIYRIIKALPAEVIEEPKLDLTQFSMDAPDIKEELDPPVEEEIPPMEKTIQFLPPVVTDDEVDEEVFIQDESDTKVSTETNVTDNENFEIAEKKKEPEKIVEPEKPTVYTYVDEPAAFKGNLKQYLADNIKYPQTAVELGIEGKCYLQFIVSASGNISNVEVKRGVPDCPECDKEAVRVVKNMPDWTPGKNGGKAVHSTFNLPVSFKLQ